MGRGRRIKSVLSLLLGTTLIVSALTRSESESPRAVHQSNALISGSTVSARDATALQTPGLKPETAARVQCGARTKKGTPCKHLASPGERCAQHRGMKSILEK
jgi:hypothetical protein